MPQDRILQPEDIAAILRRHLSGEIDGASAALCALRLAGSTDRILAGHRTREVVEAYWEIRRLAESGRGRPGRDRLQYLLDCVEGRRRLPIAG
ncbi:MAG TPA: hypothetical protein VFP98_06050 [Candidatus Polarisedimenticolia bacterium]|nr:hypothetical protein [Candidatus Polarisedimenticolia bacterium]